MQQIGWIGRFSTARTSRQSRRGRNATDRRADWLVDVISRFVVWSGSGAWNAEAAHVRFDEDGLSASGVQLGAAPAPYRLDYRLQAPRRFITTKFELTAAGEGWRRRLVLSRDASGRWDAETDDDGPTPGGAGGGGMPDLSGALDCDLQSSPLTNTMPVLREGLDRGGSKDFKMAWIAVPDLRVHASPQRYEHVRRDEAGSVVRYISLDGDFSAELELDADGLVINYPQLARRVVART
jgi:uncharacterized protein